MHTLTRFFTAWRSLSLWVVRLRYPSPDTTEWFCLRSALWWVLQLAPAFGLFASNDSFRALSHVGSEAAWQRGMGALLAFQLLASLLGFRPLRIAAFALFGMCWAFIAGLFWAGNTAASVLLRFALHGQVYTLHWTHNTGFGVYMALAADCMVCAIYLAQTLFVDFLARQEKVRREKLKQEELKQEELKGEHPNRDVDSFLRTHG